MIWGDNPDAADGVGAGNYSTLARDNGPRHQIVPGLYLGAIVDSERDGQPTAGADGDDLIAAPDDEDGVTFPFLMAGSSATLYVQVTNTTGSTATVNGFIDWNGDGDFADANEVATAPVPNGVMGAIALLFNVPLDVANAQNVAARFRLSTEPNLGPNGPATDGEVEDYLVPVHHTVQPLLAVGNYIWNDANGDGKQQQGEQPLSGAVVALFWANGLTAATDANGNAVVNQTTAADGRYLFENLLAGDYVIKVTPPLGYLPTLGGADPDNNDNNDSNGLPGDAVHSLPITLTSGDEPTDGENTNPDYNSTADFGFYRPVTVGDRVWADNNGNGAQDDPTSEPGVLGIVVALYNASTDQRVLLNGSPVTATTDNNGLYLFEQLPPGAYYVGFNLNTLPTGYLVTIQNGAGVAAAADSDADLTTGQTHDTDFLPGGSKDLDLDLGIYRSASIGNYAWFDMNKDGLKDEDEPGVAGISVNLYNVQGNLIATILTNHDGYFQFAGLTPGDYYLEFVSPPNYTFTVPGMEGEFNSDADPSNGRTVLTTLAPGENDPSWGVGFVSLATGEDETAEPKLVNYIYLPWVTQ